MKLKLLLAASICVTVAGCASIKLHPGANKVIASPNKAPKGCKFLGQVSGNQGNFFTGGWTSNKNLEQGAQNALRNETVKLGGNYVQLITNRASDTGSGGSFGGSYQQTGVVAIGNAYKCPPHAIGE